EAVLQLRGGVVSGVELAARPLGEPVDQVVVVHGAVLWTVRLAHESDAAILTWVGCWVNICMAFHSLSKRHIRRRKAPPKPQNGRIGLASTLLPPPAPRAASIAADWP